MKPTALSYGHPSLYASVSAVRHISRRFASVSAYPTLRPARRVGNVAVYTDTATESLTALTFVANNNIFNGSMTFSTTDKAY